MRSAISHVTLSLTIKKVLLAGNRMGLYAVPQSIQEVSISSMKMTFRCVKNTTAITLNGPYVP